MNYIQSLINNYLNSLTENTLKDLETLSPMPKVSFKSGLISIVIPVLNAAKHLEILFPSLVAQTYKRFEVIVSNDSATSDHTSEVLKKYSSKLKIVHEFKSENVTLGRKSASRDAKGEFLLHLDADMKLSPKVLEECIKKIAKFDALVIPEVSYGQGFWANAKIFERSMYVGDDTVESARFFRASVYRAVGGHTEKMILSEDKDIDLRVRRAGYKVGRINETIYHNEGNFSIFYSMKKKFYYGRKATLLMLTNPAYALKYGNIVFRPAFFRNWRRLISHPVLAISVFIMKSLETIAGLVGMFSSKIPLLKEDLKSNIWK